MRIILASFMMMWSVLVHADPTPVQLSLWTNEALMTLYHYDHAHYLTQQQQSAKYFTVSGWTDYAAAQRAAGIPTAVRENQYAVTAVPLEPPTITVFSPGIWKGELPLLVVYKNKQQEQKQQLQVTIYFKAVRTGGTRGLAIERLQSVVKKAPCTCELGG